MKNSIIQNVPLFINYIKRQLSKGECFEKLIFEYKLTNKEIDQILNLF